jgi:chromosome segregation ATPase
MSLTEQIYDELMNGLYKGVDWKEFLGKYGASKGPLYNAIGRVVQNVGAQVEALGEDRRKAQEEVNQSGLVLDSLNRSVREAESILQTKTDELSAADEKRSSLENQIERLKRELNEKDELIKQVGEIEKSGFDIDRLRELKDALTEIGAKRGLKGKEAIGEFFDDLKDYDAKTSFEMEIQRLETIIATRKLEAEKWQAEAEKMERQSRHVKEAIDAIQAFVKRGVRPKQIVCWNNILTSSGGVEKLEDGLQPYGSIEKLLAAKKIEGKRLDTKVTELKGKLNELKEQKAAIEGSIKVLRASTIAEIERVAQSGLETLRAQRTEMEGSIKTLKTSALNEMKEISQVGVEEIGKVVQAGNNSIRQTGEVALTELKEGLLLVDRVSTRALEVGKMIGQIENKLDKSKETREKAATLVAAIERGK